ncbi:AsmA family protein [Roseicella sp. DB1501]|uniref:AsmA family protein n=1 Tax=Roseicella sp. DB1501 TaxID=2730925 RepID=UPI00149210AD|nr:AsmA family protein [Roseicella sp. DB1501]NOG69009.1 AsmA family protein [Roseicella sp. DB1501]
MPDPGPLPPPRRRRRWPWVAGAAVGLLVVLPAIGAGIALARFDPDSLKPRIEAAVQQATGRRLTLAGPIGLKLALVPTLTVEGAALANMPGGSRPEMARVRRVEVELALLPLLRQRVEVRRLRLVEPDILLETDAAGHANWVFAGPAAPPPAAGPAAGPAPAGSRFELVIDRVSIAEGRLTWHDGAAGSTRILGIPSFQLEGGDGRGPMRGWGSLALDGVPLAVEGQAGSLQALTAPQPGAPWPVRARLATAGATAQLDGQLSDPARGRGWSATLAAEVPALQSLAPLLPSIALPPLQAVTARLTLVDPAPGGATQGRASGPALTGLDLSIGPSPLDAVLPGLALSGLTARQSGPGAPLALAGQAVLRGLPITLGGTLGLPALAPAGAAQPLPVDLTLTAGGATATAKGSIADPRRLSGVGLLVALGVPDLAALSPLAGRPLPPLRNLTAGASLSERGAGLAEGALLQGLRIASSAGDAAGALALLPAAGPGGRPGVQASLASQRIDLDALRLPPAPPAPPGAAPAATPAPPPPPAPDGRVIPPLPLPVGLLRLTDSTLRWTIGTLQSGGVTLRDTTLQASVQGGQGRIDPLTTTLPGGTVTLRAAADANAAPPAFQLAARSDGIELAPLLAALRLPGGTGGRLELDADLRGQGPELRAVAATATGHLGLALTNGEIETGAGSLLGQGAGALRQALPQLGNEIQGRIRLACAATRWRAEGGVARAETLLLDTSLGRIGGGGTADLRNESLAMRLQLDLRLPIPGTNGLRIRAPLPITGSFAHPRADFGPASARGAIGALAERAGAEGLGGGKAGELAAGILGALGGAGEGKTTEALPDCGPALAAARGGRAGPVPASAAATAAEAPAQKAPDLRDLPKSLQEPAQELLRGFLRGR